MHPPAVLQQHQRAFNPEYRMRESISPSPGAIDLGNARKRGCNPRFEVHPIPRRAINNIPILDTIHLEINRQPIGKPGQIDFEIDNLRSLVRARVCSLVRLLSRLVLFVWQSIFWHHVALDLSKYRCIRHQGSRFSRY